MILGTAGTAMQVAVGLYVMSVEPPPAPGFGSIGLAITFGSVIMGVACAFIGALVGFLIDGIILILENRRQQYSWQK